MSGLLGSFFNLLNQKSPLIYKELEDAFAQSKLAPDEADINGVTLLLYSLRKFNLKVAEILLNEGANPFIVSKYGQCAAGLITRIGDEKLKQMLLEWGNETQSIAGGAEPWPVAQGVCQAAALGDCDRLRKLLLSGESPDQRDAWGHTALLLAAVHGHEDAAELLLKNGADPQTPQTLAELKISRFAEAVNDQQELTISLFVNSVFEKIHKGIIVPPEDSVPITSDDLNSVLSVHRLAAKGDASKIGHLIALGVSPSLVDSFGQTAVQVAEQACSATVLEQVKNALSHTGTSSESLALMFSNGVEDHRTAKSITADQQDWIEPCGSGDVYCENTSDQSNKSQAERLDVLKKLTDTDFNNPASAENTQQKEANADGFSDPRIGRLSDDDLGIFSKQAFVHAHDFVQGQQKAEAFTLVPPSAASLTESLRGMGYSLGDAVADIIDNSITAKARQVWVEYATGKERGRWFLIRDNGAGMDEAEIRKAMKLGSRSPKEIRQETDLGRFGLGLKTASFSQCRRLVVCSVKNGNAVAYAWDLDTLAQKDEWALEKIDTPLNDHRFACLKDQISGTAVLWEKVDRAFGAPDTPSDEFQKTYYDALDRLKKHLQLTFHQYLTSDQLLGHPELEIYFGPTKQKLVPWDPFFSMSFAAPYRYQEEFWPEKGPMPLVSIQPYILPNPATSNEKITLFSDEDLLDMQGFFIYRGKRLICCAGWLGLGIQKSNLHSLARIKLAFDNQHDLDWQLDIRKSRVRIPRKKGWNRLRQLLYYRADAAAKKSEEILGAVLEKGGSLAKEKKAKISSVWSNERGVSPLVDCCSELGAAFHSALLHAERPETVQGLLELLAYAHPSQAKKASFAPVSPLARAAIVELVYELAEGQEENVQRALAILTDEEPFRSWPAIMNEFKEVE